MFRKFVSIAGCLAALVSSHNLLAEGSYQVGLNQPLHDYASGQILYVDVLTAGEVINLSLCGANDADTVQIRLRDPGDTEVVNTSFVSNVSCSDGFTAPLTSPYRYTTTQAGTYTLWLDSVGGATLQRFDVTVTPDSVTDPDPTEQGGRLWAERWSFDTGSFALSSATDANYYALVPGGRVNTNYTWQLDLNNLAGFVYDIVANDRGVDAPYSGYSVPIWVGSVTPKYPLYLGYPVVANPRPVDPPVITGYRFIDSDGQDMGISPSTTPAVQDSGTFEFTSDVAGNYAIIIDTNQNGIYGAFDKVLLGNVTAGLNQVVWNGDDVYGNPLAPGLYNARLQVRLGEYHFIANDAETSGGVAVAGAEDGLTIFLANSDGSLEDGQVYWDDETFLSGSGGVSNLPDGVLASTSAGKHTWGDFTLSGLGNDAYIDTFVYGLNSYATAQSAIVNDDTLLTGTDGSLSSTPATLTTGDSLTLEVIDADLNILPGVAETVVVVVSNGRSGEVEQLMLTETGVNTGVFSQVVSTQLHPQAGVNNDGILRIWDGDVITSSYQDQLDSSGATSLRTAQSTMVHDQDGDGIGDSSDLDDDNDGITDADEGGASVDTDADGVVDSFDLDSDNDGLFDLDESGATTSGLDGNGDGVIDGGFGANGLADSLETTPDSGTINYTLADTDGDTVHDFRDLDSDNDGITDVIESGGTDGDGDAIVGIGTPTVDGEGVPAGGGLTPADSDGDGIGDQQELDADGDGISDLVESGGSDSNGDGLVDGFSDSNGDGLDDSIAGTPLTPTDSNGDGLPDYQDNTDSDNDGLVNTLDLDDDNDGIPDTDEGSEAVDTDGDGVPDSLDLDSDNDGLYDLIESGADVSGLDGDHDGVIDSGFGGNGLADALETAADSGSRNYTLRDTDGDTVHDFRDLDSDGDGLADVVEAGGADADADGIIGSGTPTVDGNGVPSAGGLTPPDYNHDGVPDTLDSGDGDADGILDSLDLDLDNDGIPNAAEGDGLVDSDGDGTPDTLDLDSDGDGLFDLVEAGGSDINGDGLVDGFSDLNGDGLDDGLAASPLPLTDSNGDGTPDFQDATDSDGDGLVDSIDLDDDNDGILDMAEGGEAVDSDGDGVPDSLDLDSDNDGLFDLVESGAAVSALDADSDGRIDSGFGGNGLADALETAADSGSVDYTLRDSDGDGVADFRDLDSDGDGFYDLPEAGGSDTDNDGLVDGLRDLDGDGLHDTLSGAPLTPPDSDADGVVDLLDLDSDNDGLFDVTEAGAADADGDGLLGSSPQSVDSHGVASGSGLLAVDTDGDGIADKLDLDSDNDGIADVSEVGGADPDGDGRVGSGAPVVDVQGVTAAPMPQLDTDGDGTPNPLDSDADGDGLLDIVEGGGVDSNADGRVDGFNDGDGDGLDDATALTPLPLPDMDGDGLADFLDNDDQDGDGVPDSVDLDLDNDGIPNDLEGDGLVDTDNDGVPDSRDLDSDNDGLFDLYESGADSALLDGNGDGRIDAGFGVGGNGLADSVESSTDSGTIGYNGGLLLDSDGDGVADFRDLDSDNDGLYDVTESNGSDADSDGVLGSGSPAVNGDGLASGSGLTPPDSDGDGVVDPRDLDSDNDGVTDVIEAGGSDGDGDGHSGSGTPAIDPNTGVPLAGGGLPALDSDGDGTPDQLDLDSDGDGRFDLQESGSGATDSTPRDGIIDAVLDSNGNGLDDSLEGMPPSLPDSDGDGIPDLFDSTDASTSGSEQPLRTGLNGVGGCTLGSGAFDPLLPLLVMMALTYLGLGRRKNGNL